MPPIPSRVILEQLPDLPRFVEIRSLFLENAVDVLFFQEGDAINCILRESGTGTAYVIGQPETSVLEAIIRDATEIRQVIVPGEHAAQVASVLTNWAKAGIIVHTLPDDHQLLSTSTGQVSEFAADAIETYAIPADLATELRDAAEYTKILATWVDQKPVAFCYAGSQTETWWDVSIDTLPEHQRRGHASLCVSQLIRLMQEVGKRPVWQAFETNEASWKLAQKLGFEPIDRLVQFDAPLTSHHLD